MDAAPLGESQKGTFMVRLLQVCAFWFGMLLVPAVGYLMLELALPSRSW